MASLVYSLCSELGSQQTMLNCKGEEISFVPWTSFQKYLNDPLLVIRLKFCVHAPGFVFTDLHISARLLQAPRQVSIKLLK